MNKYKIFLLGTDPVEMEGASYLIDRDKGCLFILNDKKWKIGTFFLSSVCGFTVDIYEEETIGTSLMKPVLEALGAASRERETKV